MQARKTTRQYLQFIFGLLNRLVEDRQIHFDQRPINYVPMIIDIWQLDSGKQDMTVLAAILQRGKAAYMNWCQRRHAIIMKGILQKEYEAYQGGQPSLALDP